MALTKCPQGYVITTADSGNTLQLGDAGHGNSGGAITIEFLPTLAGGFTGSITVVGRIGGGPLSRQESALGLAYAQVPYRQIYLNGAVQLYEIVNTAITGASIIQVPAAGLSIGLLVTCTAGSGSVYFRTLEGATAP